MLIMSLLFGMVGYTLMYAGLRVPVDANGSPVYTFVYEPWQLWSYAASKLASDFNPQTLAAAKKQATNWAGQFSQKTPPLNVQIN